MNRRMVLQSAISAAILGASGCCSRDYARTSIAPTTLVFGDAQQYMAPHASLSSTLADQFIVDAHAHFFNASDVPVKDFVAQSIGHSLKGIAKVLAILLSKLAETIALAAPTASEELDWLTTFEDSLGPALSEVDAQLRWEELVEIERTAAANRVVSSISNSKFLRKYRDIQRQAMPSSSRRSVPSSSISPQEVLEVVNRTEIANSDDDSDQPKTKEQEDAEIADGFLGFLFYMLSMRGSNLNAYQNAYTDSPEQLKVSCVLGALVDFDYWQNCPPPSSHDDQIALHQLLSKRSDGYMRPLVAYNPWTDIELAGEGLERVKRAIATGSFVGVKIYPPMGFYPSDNLRHPIKTKLKRPDLGKLDDVLGEFFSYCKDHGVPVMSHTSHSNGRDKKHDNFGGPDGWEWLLKKHASDSGSLKLNLGHFGSATYAEWTQQFAGLMEGHPHHRVYADLGFWDSLHSQPQSRSRLKEAIGTRISDIETVADRTLFGTDWLMLSRKNNWPNYTSSTFDAVKAISDIDTAMKIFGSNAATLFSLR